MLVSGAVTAAGVEGTGITNLFVYVTSPVLRSNLVNMDPGEINGEIKIMLLDDPADCVNREIKIINPNRGEYSVCIQHCLTVYNHDIKQPFVLGGTWGVCNSPATTDYIIVDFQEFVGLKLTKQHVTKTFVHELMHGSSVEHHGLTNEKIQVEGVPRSFALWDGVNSGDITCIMQYGWGDFYKLADGRMAVDDKNNLIPFIDTKNQRSIYLCESKTGGNQNTQLGIPKDGNCLGQVTVTDE